ncbi:outer membrane protein TolC [Paraburkholderia phenoliruptrix]|uniref:hypothetical protein n=1 Tax=Paraburkholderia phenoliruptrix TaxID=252970 RepID=UPI002855D1A0|nr:hypothetical protein [Paraburkholderia phenoliruptrix]MDR6423822.1 outer membrane protein TolC [Paraburkholderia phenoliruptrix]
MSAFQDVEDYLSAVRITSKQAAAAQAVAQRSGELAASQARGFAAGTASRMDVLDTKLTEAQDRKTSPDYSGQALQDAVLLVKALGGGWQGQIAPIAPAEARQAVGGQMDSMK